MNKGLKDIIYNTVIEANKKVTPGAVEKAVGLSTGADRDVIKLAIRELVGQGELCYTYVYGTSYLEKSFDRPIRISGRIVIKPPNKLFTSRPGEIVIDIVAEAAFGSGAHPSTVLALRALDVALLESDQAGSGAPLQGLDVGTGTGILAIAMTKLGVRKVVAVDIDPGAVFEAARNVQLNDLSHRISVSDVPAEKLGLRFGMMVANLAHPALQRQAPLFSEIMDKHGLVILSGFREEVLEPLCSVYSENGFTLVRQEGEREWVAVTFRKSA